MKKIFLIILIFLVLASCASIKIKPFTGISFVEIIDENTKIYHVRYPDYVALNTEVGPAIYKIEGVQGAHVIPYQCIVVKSPVYKWEEIDGQIKALLMEFEAEIEKGYQEPIIPEQKVIEL